MPPHLISVCWWSVEDSHSDRIEIESPTFGGRGCMSLIANDIEHFSCVLAICISSFEEALSRLSAHFFFSFEFLLLVILFFGVLLHSGYETLAGKYSLTFFRLSVPPTDHFFSHVEAFSCAIITFVNPGFSSLCLWDPIQKAIDCPHVAEDVFQ